jgi:hypothetical protein
LSDLADGDRVITADDFDGHAIIAEPRNRFRGIAFHVIGEAQKPNQSGFCQGFRLFSGGFVVINSHDPITLLGEGSDLFLAFGIRPSINETGRA